MDLSLLMMLLDMNEGDKLLVEMAKILRMLL